MFSERDIIYFDPFYFKNGNTAKPKYFVVLKNIDNKKLIASLPTRTASIPRDMYVEDGCIEKGKTFDWSKGKIVKVGKKTTREGGLNWERKNGYGANQK